MKDIYSNAIKLAENFAEFSTKPFGRTTIMKAGVAKPVGVSISTVNNSKPASNPDAAKFTGHSENGVENTEAFAESKPEAREDFGLVNKIVGVHDRMFPVHIDGNQSPKFKENVKKYGAKNAIYDLEISPRKKDQLLRNAKSIEKYFENHSEEFAESKPLNNLKKNANGNSEVNKFAELNQKDTGLPSPANNSINYELRGNDIEQWIKSAKDM